ncbi:MAG: hypothetical protein M3Y31_09480 [Gemmatimonadota bacterium]|nr:hypothetical protein [Gemmatimonadota bacterium]
MSRRSIALVVLSVLLAGCSASQAEIELPDQDVDRWVMPLDRFMDTSDIATNYAETLLMGPCMRDAGFAWEVPWDDVEAADRETSSPAGIRIFTVQIAQRYGYRSAPVTDAGAAAWTAWAYREIGDAELDAMSRCRERVRSSELPLLPGSAQYGNALAFEAYDAAEQGGAVRDTARAWRECMADVGVPDLPQTPRGMPSMWLIETLDLGDPHGIASGEEIRFATADAECRDESGFIDSFYQALWSKQAQLVRDNADALLRIEAMVTEHRERVAEIISENAPPAP